MQAGFNNLALIKTVRPMALQQRQASSGKNVFRPEQLDVVAERVLQYGIAFGLVQPLDEKAL